MFRKRSTNRRIAITVGRNHLYLLIVQTDGTSGNGCPLVQGGQVRWRDKSLRLESSMGRRELAAACKRLASQWGIDGQRVSIALAADFCATRVLYGTETELRKELARLSRRSERYLLLGRGEKVLAESIAPLDARQQMAIVAVTNRGIVDALFEATDAAGLRIERIEPASVALCRAVGTAHLDEHAPVLLVSLDDESVDVVISHRGRLVLDYRPGGAGRHKPQGHGAALVGHHLHRLQRYCARYHRHAEGPIDKLYLCGPKQLVDQQREQYAQSVAVSVEPFLPASIQPTWQFDPAIDDPAFSAALGMCLAHQDEEASHAGPDLRRAVGVSEPTEVGHTLRWISWGVAAAVLLSVGSWSLAIHQKICCRRLERQLAQLVDYHEQASQLMAQSTRAQLEIDLIRQIEQGVGQPRWRRTIRAIAQCLPPTTWLDGLVVDDTAHVSLDGASLDPEDVYHFAEWLSKTPGFTNTYVEGTRPLRLPVGDATAFEIETELAAESNELENDENFNEKSG